VHQKKKYSLVEKQYSIRKKNQLKLKPLSSGNNLPSKDTMKTVVRLPPCFNFTFNPKEEEEQQQESPRFPTANHNKYFEERKDLNGSKH
jgi:hypothetical protein